MYLPGVKYIYLSIYLSIYISIYQSIKQRRRLRSSARARTCLTSNYVFLPKLINQRGHSKYSLVKASWANNAGSVLKDWNGPAVTTGLFLHLLNKEAARRAYDSRSNLGAANEAHHHAPCSLALTLALALPGAARVDWQRLGFGVQSDPPGGGEVSVMSSWRWVMSPRRSPWQGELAFWWVCSAPHPERWNMVMIIAATSSSSAALLFSSAEGLIALHARSPDLPSKNKPLPPCRKKKNKRGIFRGINFDHVPRG